MTTELLYFFSKFFLSKELREQRSIINHCLPQFFCVCLFMCIFQGYLLRRAIMTHQIGVLDRDIGRPLFKIRELISLDLHDLNDQSISFRNRLAWLVNEF